MVVHRAYTFDPLAFHKYLKEKIGSGDNLDLLALQQIASDVVSNASDTTLQILEAIRFDDEWFDTSHPDDSFTTHWYILALVAALRKAPSLSNRSLFSWELLKLGLPEVGWSEADVKLLVYGELLKTLIESSGDSRFLSEFVGISQFGGWLSLDTIRRLLPKLDISLEALPARQREVRESLAFYAEIQSEDPLVTLRLAFADAAEMLNVAISRNEALFLILDY
jgi:hypothetical protein